MLRTFCNTTAMLAASTLLGACSSAFDRLEKVGLPPEMEKVQNPVESSNYVPISWPSSQPFEVAARTPNSLWQKGSKAFFKDGRARDVGDIVTVKVSISDKAELENKTERKRNTNETLAAPRLFGAEEKLSSLLSEQGTPSSLLNVTGATTNNGEGTIEREETIETNIAATVTQVLPNGHMVIYGKQEIVVNFEKRQLTVQGVIRPDDITPENIVSSNQIAEARISYGGEGHIFDVQQPRIGSQIVDIVSPF